MVIIGAAMKGGSLMKEFPIIETKRLILREVNVEDEKIC